MKKNYAKYGVVLLIGLVIGIIIGVMLGSFVIAGFYTKSVLTNDNTVIDTPQIEDDMPEVENTPTTPDVSDEPDTAPEEDTAAPQETKDPVEVTETYLDTECTEWDAKLIYVEGDLAIYKNQIYRAKWWTQGNQPGGNEVWELTNLSVDDLITVGDLLSEREVNIVNTTASNDEDFKVVAYFPSWKIDGLDKVDYSVITHIIYAFAIPTKEGGLMELENADLAKFIIEEAHANNRKALLAVGGWSYNEIPLEATFMEATNSDEKIKKFGDAILAMCNEYGFDGIDMDWEHPRFDGTSMKRYESLMLYLAQELHKQDKILTSAVLSGVTAQGQVYYDAQAHTDAVLDAVDWLNIMAYDGGDGINHSNYEFAINCGTYWNDTRGLEDEKVVLGVPFYGRPSWATYEELLAADPLAYSSDLSSYKGMEVYYNGVDTITQKTDYAKENFGGIMIWEITQDAANDEYSLLQSIKEAIVD